MSEFQNPNQQPGTERRLLFVFALTFLVLMIGQMYLSKYGPKQQPQNQQQQQQSAQQSQPTQPQVASSTPAPASTAAQKQVAANKAAAAEQETVVDTPVFHVVFTNKGGLVKSWVLKKFTDDKGKPLDLVNQAAADAHGYPLSLFTDDQGLRGKLNSVLYVVSENKSADQQTVAFEYADGEIDVRKSFGFDLTGKSGSSYVVKADVTATRGGQMVAAFPAWPAGFGDEANQFAYGGARIDYLPTGTEKVQRLSPDRKGEKVGNYHKINGPFAWGGTLDQYFAAVFLPDNPQQATLVQFRNALDIPKDPNKPESKETLRVEVLGAAAGNPNGPTSERIFVGPKNLDVLDSVQNGGANLGGLIDFGFFGIIAKPLFLWLKWTQAHVSPNWGWSIVILTVIINLALLPLRVSGMKSALKMQKVQPQVNSIKKKYEKFPMRDPRRQEMNVEIQALFKEHGVNPVGGCLPMIIQMPFLFAFYTMLGVTTELRHAPWLWIKDLAAPDPYYILPVLIVVSTYYMQKMTPNAGMDPAQQKMMNIFMPVMLGWISYRLAAGLGVYWIIGTLIAVIQQWVMNRTSLGQEMRAEAEKRARKQQQKGVVKK